MTVLVRRAVEADAESVTGIHLQAWREAYTGLIPESLFAEREAQREQRVATWREIIAGRSPFGNERAFVAEVDSRVVGWATASDGRDDDAPFPNELNGLYILAELYGRDIGRGLLEAAIGTSSGAYVWALDGNGRAESFYRKQGFERDGATKSYETGGASMPEFRMVRLPQ